MHSLPTAMMAEGRRKTKDHHDGAIYHYQLSIDRIALRLDVLRCCACQPAILLYADYSAFFMMPVILNETAGVVDGVQHRTSGNVSVQVVGQTALAVNRSGTCQVS